MDDGTGALILHGSMARRLMNRDFNMNVMVLRALWKNFFLDRYFHFSTLAKIISNPSRILCLGRFASLFSIVILLSSCLDLEFLLSFSVHNIPRIYHRAILTTLPIQNPLTALLSHTISPSRTSSTITMPSRQSPRSSATRLVTLSQHPVDSGGVSHNPLSSSSLLIPSFRSSMDCRRGRRKYMLETAHSAIWQSML